MGSDTHAAGDGIAGHGRVDLRVAAGIMSAPQRDHAKALCKMIAFKMPIGVVRHMLERAARDASTDDTIRKIDEQMLFVIHYTLDFWESGRTHNEMVR